MRVYRVTMGSYSNNIVALDRQHARTKFTNNMFATEPGFPITENLGSISVYELDGDIK